MCKNKFKVHVKATYWYGWKENKEKKILISVLVKFKRANSRSCPQSCVAAFTFFLNSSLKISIPGKEREKKKKKNQEKKKDFKKAEYLV